MISESIISMSCFSKKKSAKKNIKNICEKNIQSEGSNKNFILFISCFYSDFIIFSWLLQHWRQGWGDVIPIQWCLQLRGQKSCQGFWWWDQDLKKHAKTNDSTRTWLTKWWKKYLCSLLVEEEQESQKRVLAKQDFLWRTASFRHDPNEKLHGAEEGTRRTPQCRQEILSSVKLVWQ